MLVIIDGTRINYTVIHLNTSCFCIQNRPLQQKVTSQHKSLWWRHYLIKTIVHCGKVKDLKTMLDLPLCLQCKFNRFHLNVNLAIATCTRKKSQSRLPSDTYMNTCAMSKDNNSFCGGIKQNLLSTTSYCNTLWPS